MPIYQLDQYKPQIAASAYLSDSCTIIGKVSLGERVSVWFNSTLRGDNELISVGAGSNIQEGCILHTDPGFPLNIAENVTVGHQAMLHGCEIGAGSLIGIQAVILNGAKIGKNCLVGAGALITEGKVFPDNSLIIGSPARVARSLTETDLQRMQANALNYAERSQHYKTSLIRLD